MSDARGPQEARTGNGPARITAAIRSAAAAGRPALAAFLTAGYPDRDRFPELLARVAGESDLVEIGVPFSDPMADGLTIQRSSRIALEHGVDLTWILDVARRSSLPAPVILMSYLNPLLAFGLDDLATAARDAGVSGFIVPDLPLEESAPIRERLDRVEVALIQLVTPVTPADRVATLARASGGFVYAVTGTGTTGGAALGGATPDRPLAITLTDTLSGAPLEAFAYLDRVRSVSPIPVLAGFGIRSAGQLRALDGHVDGVIVGSALIETIDRGEDPVAFLRGLRSGGDSPITDPARPATADATTPASKENQS